MSLRDAFDDLEDSITGEDDYDLDQPATEYPVPDADEANRTLRRIARLRKDAEDYREVFNAEVLRLRERFEERIATFERAEAFHVARLGNYHRAILAKDPKRKTITVPEGALKARSQQPEWTFDDPLFVKWALLNGHREALRFAEPEVDKNAAKDLLTRKDAKGKVVKYGITEDGVVPPGVTVTERGPKFDAVT